jgi:hypothetical protein
MEKIKKDESVITGCDDDDGAEEPDLGIRQTEVVDPLRQLEHRVHEEPGVARRHLLDRLLANDVPVQTHQTLEIRSGTNVINFAKNGDFDPNSCFIFWQKRMIIKLNFKVVVRFDRWRGFDHITKDISLSLNDRLRNISIAILQLFR